MQLSAKDLSSVASIAKATKQKNPVKLQYTCVFLYAYNMYFVEWPDQAAQKIY